MFINTKIYLFILPIISLNLIKNIYCFEPISIGIAVGGGLAALGYNYNTILDHTYCKLKECCIDDHIPVDIKGLKADLDNFLFGQHIVSSSMVSAINHHYGKSQSTKPLVIAFHGTPGVGKNYVTDILAKNIYKRGTRSKYVHKFVGRIDFPLKSQVEVYQQQLKEKILNAIKLCPKSLFIFDEVDKTPAGTFDLITPYLDYHHVLHGHDFRDAIFLFLSNNAGVEIAEQLLKLNKIGILREDSRLSCYEKVIELAAYNLDGGLKNAPIIESSLLDYYMPFLPLEKKHVRQCVEKEFLRLHVIPTEQEIEEISTTAVQYQGIFSQSGCKKISKKVEVHIRIA